MGLIRTKEGKEKAAHLVASGTKLLERQHGKQVGLIVQEWVCNQQSQYQPPVLASLPWESLVINMSNPVTRQSTILPWKSLLLCLRHLLAQNSPAVDAWICDKEIT